MLGPRDYKQSEIKRLFALSGNQCSEPNCQRTMVAEDGVTIIAKICHIEAASKLGPRWRLDMTDNERRSYDNLILLCDEHHSIIDNKDNEMTYSVALLKEWRESHQKKFFSNERLEFSDTVIKEFIEELKSLYSPTNTNVNVGTGKVNVQNIGTQFNEYLTHHDELTEESIIKAVFDNALELLNTDNSIQESRRGKDLVHTLDKIKINFTKVEDEFEVRSYFTYCFSRKMSLERYLSSLEPESQLDLENHIFTTYRGLRGTYENIELLRELFKIYTPEGKETNPMYLRMAQAFVLLFLEDCTIFEKTKDEIKGQQDLFSNL